MTLPCSPQWPNSARSRPPSSVPASNTTAQADGAVRSPGQVLPGWCRYFAAPSRRSTTRAKSAPVRSQELDQIAQGVQDADLHRVRDRQLAVELEAALAEMGPGLEAGAGHRSRHRHGTRGAAESAMSRMAGALGNVQPVIAPGLRPPPVQNAPGSRSWKTSCAGLAAASAIAPQQEHGNLSAADVAATLASLAGQETEAREPSTRPRAVTLDEWSRPCRPNAAANANWPRQPRVRGVKHRRSRVVSCRSRRCSVRRSARGRARSSTGSSRAASTAVPRLAQQLNKSTRAGTARSRPCSAATSKPSASTRSRTWPARSPA